MWWSFGWGIAFGVESESGGFNQFTGPGSFFARGAEFEDDTGNYGTVEGYSWALWLFQVYIYTHNFCSNLHRWRFQPRQPPVAIAWHNACFVLSIHPRAAAFNYLEIRALTQLEPCLWKLGRQSLPLQ